jgi:DNA-binding MarR family transcriptional regulator
MRHGEHVRVRDVAAYFHVSAAFVTTEAGKLAQMGLLRKLPSTSDGRSRLLSLTRQGEAQLERLTPDIREVNDRFFASLDRSDFLCVSRIARELVKDSKRALEFLSLAAPDRTTARPIARTSKAVAVTRLIVGISGASDAIYRVVGKRPLLQDLPLWFLMGRMTFAAILLGWTGSWDSVREIIRVTDSSFLMTGPPARIS